jgi:uncharacterized protein
VSSEQTPGGMATSEAGGWRSWQGLLALVSLGLSALLWVNGLVGSLERPSVGDALVLRQLELALLAEPATPPPLRGPLLGGDPAAELRRELDGQPFDQASPLQQRLRCELERPAGLQPSRCGPQPAPRQALLRLLLLTVAPVLLLLLGVGLLLRQLWLAWRRKLPAPAPLQGPPLSLVQVTLLIAGGFVVLGELLAPLLLAPLLRWLLTPLAASPALQQGASVLGLYLGLTLAPLLILVLLLRGLGPRPSGGWLQWQWQPWGLSLRSAGSQLLMVLPLVALVGWLLERLWGDPGGSNPLLELVLTSPSPVALALMGLTATVLAPLFEETLFRGVLLPVLARHWGGFWAVVLSAAVFALAHLSLGELAPLFVLGLGLGWLRLRGGRLGASVLMHGLWNGLTFANLLLLAG